MPILLPPDPDSPLEQGDVLGEVQTYVADYTTPEVGPIMEDGYVLLISRPCNALRSRRLVVAEVVKRTLPGLKEAANLKEMKEFFASLRDGEGMPDTFYLGELEPGTDRYVAKLDSLRTLQVPVEGASRQAFIKKYRRFRLNPEFARDLHVRVFRAFASLGFDDDAWWTDADLTLSKKSGEAEVNTLRAEVAGLETRIELLKTGDGGKKDLREVEEQLKEKRPALASAEAELAPLLAEFTKRKL